MTADARRRVAARVATAGATLLLLAGLVQTALGAVIPDWTGDKLEPVALGLLTVALAAAALVAARRLRAPDLAAGVRLAWTVALAGPGLLGLSTVGVLGWAPAALLSGAGVLGLFGHGRDAVAAAGANGVRVLLSALGCCQLLMAAGAAPLPLVIGALSGVAMIVSAWLRTAPRGPLVGIALLGLLPFAGAGWTAIVPLVLAVVALPMVVVVVRRSWADQPTPAAVARRGSGSIGVGPPGASSATERSGDSHRPSG